MKLTRAFFALAIAALLAAFLLAVSAMAGTVNNSRTGNPASPSGTFTVNHCLKAGDTQGNYVDAGANCGSGSGTVSSVSSPNGTITVGSPTTTPTLDVVYGTATNTAAQGNDSRITGAVQNTTTVAGHALSSNVSIACADLSNGATGCSTATGTSGATIPLLNANNTRSGAETDQFSSSTVSTSFSNSGTPPITSGIWSRVVGSTLSSNTRDFNWGVSYSPNINLPGDARGDTVVSIGWNIKGDATCQDATDSCTRIGFEDHYLQGGVAPAANEIHITSKDTNGVEHRAFSYFAPKNGGAGSLVGLTSDVFNWFNYAGTQQIKFDSTAGTKNISFPNGDYQFQFANNKQDLVQKNAAGSANITLIYDDADDRVRVPNNFASVGATPTTGTYANQFGVFQATSMPASGFVLRVNGPAVTGTYNVAQFDASASTGLVFIEKNTNTTSTADMEHDVQVASAGGNPFHKYIVASGTSWFVGQLHSDSSFRWGTTSLSSDIMRLSSAGQLSLETLGAGYSVKEGSNAKQGTATLSAGTVTVSNTAVTANSRIFLTEQTLGTVAIPQALAVTAKSAGTSFTITSASATDTSVVAWEIFEPSP